MGQRAVGSLLLGLLLHARLLAVSVRDRGRGARANLAGTPEAARRLGLWPGTAAPAKDPGLALASATLQRGAFLGDALGIQFGGQGPSLQAWKSEGRRPRCLGSKSPLGMARPAVLACGGADGETSSRVGTWQDRGTPFCCQLGRRGTSW